MRGGKRRPNLLARTLLALHWREMGWHFFWTAAEVAIRWAPALRQPLVGPWCYAFMNAGGVGAAPQPAVLADSDGKHSHPSSQN